uniref:39S ribosomal protein L27, mitochondrial n=1 Tax=Cacopsylla melanoneura TaxID=428564 RepID=A0A8D8QZ78_9HEMI
MALSLVNSFKGLLVTPQIINMSVRNAAKKTGTSTRNKPIRKNRGFCFPKGFRKQENEIVEKGSILYISRVQRLDYHPGLNVGFGARGTLFAMDKGKVKITVEKCNLNWKHTWVQANYAGQEGLPMYKKHIHVIPDKQHYRFKQVGEV